MGFLSSLFGKKRDTATNTWAQNQKKMKVTAEKWAQSLKGKKDYRSLAAIFNSTDWSESSNLRNDKKELAETILHDAGIEAVDPLIEELAKNGPGSTNLAMLLVGIGDPKAIPLLRKMLDRGAFSAYSSEGSIRAFILRHPGIAVESEFVRCALCGKSRPANETRGFQEDGQEKRFCVDTCWRKRGRVLKSGIGKDCPFYSEGMCEAGDGDNLCSLQVGSYATSCRVYAMFAGTGKQQS